MTAASRNAGPSARLRRRAISGRVPPRVETLESRVLLSLADETLPVPSPWAQVMPVAPPVDTEPTSPLDGWSLGSVIVTGKGPEGNAPPAKSDPLAPAVPSSVVRLPDLDLIELDGIFPSADTLQFFHVPVSPDTMTVRVEIQVPESSSSASERFWILSGEGQVLGHWPIPGPGGKVDVTVTADDENPPSGLILGISRDDLGSDTPPPDDTSYHLRIGRHDKGTTSTSPDLPSPITVPRPTSPEADTPPSIPSDSGSGGMGGTTGPIATVSFTTAISITPEIGMTTPGPLPALATGPSAGVLADGRPTPRVGRMDGLVIDLALIDLDHRPVADDEASELETVPQAGGLPLLAQARPSIRSQAESAASRVGSVAIAAPALLESPARPSDAEESPGREAGTARRPSWGLGLSMAAALSFGLYLPDLVTALTPVSPRRPRLRAFRKPRS